MEAMEIVLAVYQEVSYFISSHVIISIFGCFFLIAVLLRVYCRLTLGMCDSDQDMKGKTVLITGATAGIGKATAKDLARRNARVILACRNIVKARQVADEIISSTGNKEVVVRHLDLSSFNSVRKCAEEVLSTEEKLHVLINNAGIFSAVNPTTEDGYETVLQSNHLGHFLFTLLLLDLLKKCAPSRIINVASSSYKHGKLDLSDMDDLLKKSAPSRIINVSSVIHKYSKLYVTDTAGLNCKNFFRSYSRSKLANVLFTRELADRVANSGVTVNALHPGFVKTDILVKNNYTVLAELLLGHFAKSSEEGAQTTIYLAVDPSVKNTTGKYFADCKEEKFVGEALNKRLAKELFDASKKIVGKIN